MPKRLPHANPSESGAGNSPDGIFRNKTKSIMGASKGIIDISAGKYREAWKKF